MKPGLSVHFMVLNPPLDRMAALVEYLSIVANEFVIVDTGSSPVTTQTMQDWPKVKVIHEPFVDFATTRNKGLALHQYEWTLGVDPDELPSFAMMQHIAWAIGDLGRKRFPAAKGWLYLTKNFWGGVLGPHMDYHWHARLWKTESGKLYRPVHELLAIDGKHETQTRGTNILPKAPPKAYLIHSKSEVEIEQADKLYATLGQVSR